MNACSTGPRKDVLDEAAVAGLSTLTATVI